MSLSANTTIGQFEILDFYLKYKDLFFFFYLFGGLNWITEIMNLILFGVTHFSVCIDILNFILWHCKIIWKVMDLHFQARSEQFKAPAETYLV